MVSTLAVIAALVVGLVAAGWHARRANTAAEDATRSNAVLLDVLEAFDQSWSDQSLDTAASLWHARESTAPAP